MSVPGYVQSDAQFSQTYSSGNTTVAGSFVLGSESRVGPGACSVSVPLTLVTSNAANNALTLANGQYAGQMKYFVHSVDGGAATITPATTLHSWSSVKLTALGETATMMWTGSAWALLARQGGVAAAHNAVAGMPIVA